ncbi:MAG: pentapeptide repeat-containing protein [Nitrospinota bacterium]
MNSANDEPQPQASGQLQLRGLSPKEIEVLEVHRKWLESEGREGKRAILDGADLRRANLFKIKLRGAGLRRADLEGAILGEASLEKADLFRANLEGANLGEAKLEGADLFGANLKGANFFRADLEGAFLWGANLKGANLGGANLKGANLCGANLKGVKFITRKQIESAVTNERTRLPDSLKGPDQASHPA